MKELSLCAAIMAIVLLASCGSNSTAAGVTITQLAANPVSVPENGTQQFSATVSGVSTTTVYWQVCLPTASATVQPTNCTPIPGVTAAGAPGLTGYGTITQQGLYTAPPAIPQNNILVVMASSTVSPTVFAVWGVTVATRVQVQVNPDTASMAVGEHFQFTATVTGTQNTNVTWAVNGNAGGDVTDGYICPNPAIAQPCTAGEYFAPNPAPSSVTIKATSTDDTTASGTAAVTVSSTAIPVLNAIEPAITGEGSAQQDIYIEGTNLLNTTSVQVSSPTAPGGIVTLPASAITFITASLMRATIPGNLLEQTGNVAVTAVSQGGQLSASSFNLTVNPMRPAMVATTPDTASQAPTGTTINVTGGYFVPSGTLASFNGSTTGVTTSYQDSRHLTVTLPSGSLSTPGLYSLFVQNGDAAAAQVPSMTAKNIAVTPAPSSIGTIPIATVGVGSGPSAVAIDYATGNALVANTAENTVSVINLATNTANPNKITVGNSPTGIAVDDMISPPLALVVNSADQTVTAINLATMSVVGTPLSVALTAATNPPAPPPYSIGINPMTHHAIVAYQNTNEATILDVSTGTPVILTQIGGSTANVGYSTGNNPAIAVDERLNWAVVTPGGSGEGVVNVVDLGRNAIPGVDSGRGPQMVATATLSFTFTTQGVGINPETHQALFTDPRGGNLTSFNVFNASVNPIVFLENGQPVNQTGFVAAGANGLTNEGIAVNSGGTAVVASLDSGSVLQTVNGLGNNPAAVAVDPATNEAVIANQGDGTVSIVSLGNSRTNQIVEASPATSFTSITPVTLTITGSGFEPGATVRLDQTALATSTVASSCTTGANPVCRQLTATVPAAMLGAARRFMLDVLNADGSVSNVSDFTVIQGVVVGTAPVGVAVDTDRHMAVVTNSGDGTVSLVALSPSTPVSNNGGTAGAVGVVGSPIPTGGSDSTPQGVGVIPRLGLAVVADNQSNNFTVIDETQVASPNTQAICLNSALGCELPIGIGVNSDTGTAVITYGKPDTTNSSLIDGEISTINVATAGIGTSLEVDQLPTGVAIDPTLNYAAVADSQTGSLFLMNLTTSTRVEPTSNPSFSLPAGVVFDPLNQMFVVANSLADSVVLFNPNSFSLTPILAGINPTSVDYDFQTSTLITVNSKSNSMSVLDYDCPPQVGSPGCSNPQVRAEVNAGVPEPASSVVIGANAAAIDSQLDLVVTVDPDNNRVLLIPLPH